MATPGPEVAQVELVIRGMGCAACAAPVQAKLNQLAAVTVSLATEPAHITALLRVQPRT